MLLQAGAVRTLGGGPGQRLRFGGLRLPDGTWIGVSQLWLDDAIAFKLTPGCDTCQLLFERAVAFVRAALVDAGVLEPRDEYSARFGAWHGQAILEIAAGTDRAHVRAYATWQVAHKLARSAQRRGPSGYPSLKYAKSQVAEAIKLVCWLHEQQLELADLRQDLVDDWVAAGSMIRRRIRLFLQFLERAGVTGPLDVEWDDRLPTRPTL